MSGGKKTLKILLKKLKQEATGYIFAYDPKGKTHCACRAWLGDTWFHGYGVSEEEAVENCLNKLLTFKVGSGQEKETFSQTEEK